MASVTVNLAGYGDLGTRIIWDGNVALPGTFDDQGDAQVLDSVSLWFASGIVSILIVNFAANFTPEFEATGPYSH